jgi:hypothetical protein
VRHGPRGWVRRVARSADDDVAAGGGATRTRPRSAIEADLRGVRAARARIRAGNRYGNPPFDAVIARRTDRLLDELLRCGAGEDRQGAGAAA